MTISLRVQAISPSPSVSFHETVLRLKEEGQSIINLNVGETDFITPDAIIDATIDALKMNKTRYGLVGGEKELREHIAHLENKNYQKDFTYKNVLVGTGSKQILFNIFQSILDIDNEVIIPIPYWSTYAESVKLASGKPVFVPTTNQHQLDLEIIKKSVTEKTKAIIINTPNNPTGAIFHKETLEELIDFAKEKKIYIISDEAYEQLIYERSAISSLHQLSKEYEKLLVVRSFSKAYIMTGFRVGHLIANENLINAINKFQGHMTGNICTFAQFGAIAALTKSDKDLEVIKEKLITNKNLSYKLFSTLFDCIEPKGGFYLYLNVEKYLNADHPTSLDFANYILKETNVALLPAEAFGDKNHLRLAFCVDKEKIQTAFDKISKIL